MRLQRNRNEILGIETLFQIGYLLNMELAQHVTDEEPEFHPCEVL